MSFQTFEMERWQSTYEHDVSFNLSESGVEALTLGELMELADIDAAVLQDTLLEYRPSNGCEALRERIAAMYPGERLRVEADCLIIPGEHFDMPHYVRLGFGPETARLQEALRRCAAVIDPLHNGA